MKHFKSLFFLLFAIAMVNVTSCGDNEPIGPNIIIDPQPDPDCLKPDAFQSSNFVGNMVNLSWEAGAAETSWEVQYGTQGFAPGSGTSIITSSPNTAVNGLNPAGSYEFYVRSKCSANSFSSWTGPIPVNSSNDECAGPTSITAARNATLNTNVDVAWTATAEQTLWEIQYGPAGFSLGEGTVVASNSTTKQVAGVSAVGSFDFYVRAICSSTSSSVWVGPVTVAPAARTTVR